MRIDVDRLMIDLGITVLIGLELPIEHRIGLVNFEVAIAVEPQEDFEGSYTEKKNAQREGQVLREALPAGRGHG